MTKLQRHIGLFSLTLYGIGDILGSGIYGLVGKAAGQLGNFVWLGFLVSFVVALVTGLCYAALGSRYPRAAGSSFIVWKAFKSPFVAFVVGLATLCSGLTSMATASRIFAGYFVGMVAAVPEAAVIVGFCLLMTGIVFSGIRQSMWVNALCTFVELGGLLIIIVAALPFFGQVDLVDTSSIPAPGSLGPSLILSGAVLTFYSFIGFEDMLNVSEEVVKPERTVPMALMLSMLVASVIYMLVAVAAVSVIPAADLAASKEPLVDVMRVAWPWFPPRVFGLVALFAVFNTALLNFVMGSRLLYGLGQIGLLPRALAKVHGQTSTPFVAVLVVGVIFVTLALVGDVSALARATSLFILLVFMMMAASLFYFQRKDAQNHPHVWRLPQIVPVLAIIGSLLMISHAEIEEGRIAGVLFLLIVALYFIRRPTVAQIERLEGGAGDE